MMPEEKEQLLGLLDRSEAWCRDVEALDAKGDPVCYDDEAAVAWDITGAICRLFGWQRACVLFGQIDRHLNGKRASFGWPPPDLELDAMTALQEFNDGAETTFQRVRESIETMPVWQGERRSNGEPRDA